MVERSASRRRMLVVTAAGGVLALAAGVAWFQPQKLLIDERVDEAPPATATPPPGTGAETGTGQAPTRPPDPAPTVLATGPFRSLGHATSGRAVALELADGRRFLRLEELRTSNGPDLFVYLSTAAADAPRDAFDDDFRSLGRLKANQGSQNYVIPAGIALDRYRTVVIWCRRFTYAFGAAPLG
jgi:electron transfer DM13